ncbi:DoxX family protein [Pseudonocardia sp. CA-107938]|uniref:DoxX family protein n=1 Tax=Pseudonocardia sp. CA-107938 TaxID=3240021 RepID=UPI003D8A6F9C
MTATTITRTAAASTSAAPTARQEAARDAVVLAFRLVIGFLYAVHAVMPYGAFGGLDGQGAAAPVGSFPWVVGSLQLVGAILIAAGLWTRPTAFVLSGVMAGAYFMVHQPMGALPVLNQGEPAALYSWVFLLLVAIGPGRYALDTLRRR